MHARPLIPRLLAAAALTLATACASGGGGGGGGQRPAPGAQQQPTPAGVAPAEPRGNAVWGIKTREHVDLWLHAYAMVQDDTAQVPFFRRGYRDQLQVAKNQANAVTTLDRMRDSLRRGLIENPGLVSGQFLALNFANWDEMQRAIQLFLAAEGTVQRARNPQEAAVIQAIGGYFRNRADREFLRRLLAGVDDERVKFYHNYWVAQQQQRAAALTATDTLWQRQVRPKLQRYLNNTQQENGEVLLSLPLDGEGRTVSGNGSRNVIVVGFPERPADAAQGVYAAVHEAASQIANIAVNDNITPTQRREGLADRLASAAAVRAGLLLLERAAPELADGYARYYLAAANRPATGANPRTTLASTYALPAEIATAISRQLDVVLGGI